ncbi:MAG: phosphogluconate dehydrogenase (NAD(+)-dependent, decarboxylating) [Candidatus Methylomirabilia bacterium]
MEIGFVGLGRMGMNMVRRLQGEQHRVVTYDRDADKVKESVAHGAAGAASLEELVKQLAPPRATWVMVPAGMPTQQTVRDLSQLLKADDVIIDGGNSYYKDDARRAAELRSRGIHYLDAGTSGGVWGLKVGYCLMIGGERQIFRRLEPILKSLAPPDGYGYMGTHGAGHYVKMIHNGVEYGMMQAYAEGFELMHKSDFALDLQAIAHLWNQGSVIRSWLLELTELALEGDPHLTGVKGHVEDSGEGRWTIFDAIEKDVPAPTITLSLFTRFRSRQPESYADKLLAALRNAFGGHAVQRTREG